MTAGDLMHPDSTLPCWLVNKEFVNYYSTAWRVPLAVAYRLNKAVRSHLYYEWIVKYLAYNFSVHI